MDFVRSYFGKKWTSADLEKSEELTSYKIHILVEMFNMIHVLFVFNFQS